MTMTATELVLVAATVTERILLPQLPSSILTTTSPTINTVTTTTVPRTMATHMDIDLETDSETENYISPFRQGNESALHYRFRYWGGRARFRWRVARIKLRRVYLRWM
jgi:hypothetical protein